MTYAERVLTDRALLASLPEPVPVSALPGDDLSRELGDAIERMIATKMESYPSDWSDDDKRDMAKQHLFGKGE